MTCETPLAAAALKEELAPTLKGCTACGACQKDCAFLSRHGTPGTIGAGFYPGDGESATLAFQCSICGLCSEICPQGLHPERLFLEMRRDAARRGLGEFSAHAPLLAYERLGSSPRFALYRLPPGCSTVFFPGCSLPGTRPAAVRKLFNLLSEGDPALGIVLDCCLKPSHLLGRAQYVEARFQELKERLIQQGVRQVLVACPNCQTMFESHGSGLEVGTVWEALAQSGLQPEPASGTVTVHDPCALRSALPVQQAVRTLLKRQGVTVTEMPHSGKRTLCCGQGGGVSLLNPQLAECWRELRRNEAQGRRVVSYCAGCVEALGGHMPASHLVDLIFTPQEAMAGRKKGARAPFTYLNRLLLKWSLQRDPRFAAAAHGAAKDGAGRSRPWRTLLLVLLLIAAIAGVHLTGAASYLDQERLRALIASYGTLAPAVYILIYALAPVLFLPGLPITVAGGILFGPFWGVVYAITGATLGASLAFLAARYLARDWVAAKLTGPGWEKLDTEVARHGWKVVAFTRLIPAFPFNLLNYAFGLTKVPFAHYLLASFLCMLPACIAFIVFSSSLLELVKGQVSGAALVGGALILLLSLLPVFYRRIKGARKPGGASQ